MKNKLLFLLLTLNSFYSWSQNEFITTWKTDNPGTSNSTSISIPTFGGGYLYDVDWENDGSFDDIGVTGNIIHDYTTAGTYTVAIRGVFPRIYFNNVGDKEKILSVEQWGTQQWATSIYASFYGCLNLVINATDIPDFSITTDARSMFFNAASFNSDISNWDVSNLTTIDRMFAGTAFNQDISSWDVSSVTSMQYVFNNASAFNQDISTWDVSNVSNMTGMFTQASSFNQNLNAWNVSGAINMSYMFFYASAFNGNISTWDVTNVTNMNSMFSAASSFNQDISAWNVTNVTNMNAMFSNGNSFNQDISGWNVSSVTNMNQMMNQAYVFNQDISGWDVSSVTNMTQMFRYANNFDQNLGTWDVSSVTAITNMFNFITLSTPNYDSLLIGWSNQLLQPGLTFNGGNSKYSCTAEPARDSIIASFGWTIADSGSTQNCAAINSFITTWKTDNPGTSNSTSITIPTNGSYTYNYDVDWNDDGTFDEFGLTGDITHDFGAAGTYNIRIQGQFPSIYFNYVGDKEKILDITQWGNISWSSMMYSYAGCNYLNCSATDTPDLTNVTNMSSMFDGDTSLTGNFSSWNVSNVTNMQRLFVFAKNFTSDLSTWNVSNVTDMVQLFYDASNFTSNLNSWNVTNVTNMNAMFTGATNFNSDLNNWDISNVTDINSIFGNAISFNGDVSTWDVDSITNMNGVFVGCSAFNGNLSNWNVSNVTDMSYMFTGASTFNRNLSSWDVSNVNTMQSMFSGVTLSTPIYDSILISWSSQALKDTVLFDGGNSIYSCNADSARTSIITNYNWAITDAGPISNCFSLTSFNTTWKTDNTGTSNATSITIPTNGSYTYNYDVDWDNDGTFDQFGLTSDVTHDFGATGTYTIGIKGQFPSIYFNNAGDKLKLLDITQWGNISWVSMNNSFWGCSNLVGTATDSPDLSTLTDLSFIFFDCNNFTGDISSWDVSNVTNMGSMFENCNNFNSDLSTWDVSNVTSMFAMFHNNNVFNSDLSTWDVSNVTDMTFMFWNAFSFSSDLSNWNVSKVTAMGSMFDSAINFDSDLSNWNVSNVSNMIHMFWGASSFDQNLGNWDMDSVTNVTNMFDGATLSTTNYDSLLIGWSSQVLQPGLNFHGGNSFFCLAGDERDSIISIYSWSISDNGSLANDASFDFNDFCFGMANNAINIVTAGGTFSFNPTVVDGATINTTTGEITNGVVGATYTVEYLTTGGCSNSSTQMVTVNTLPSVIAGADQSICSGASTLLNGGGAISYAWDNGVTDGISFTPASTTTYTVTGSDTIGCSATDQLTIIVSPQPISNAGADINTCNSTNNLSGSIINAGGGIWTTTGDGAFSNDTSLTSSYTFGSADISNEFANIILTSTGNGACNPVKDTITIILDLTSQPVSNAGADINTCSNTNILIGSIINAGGGIWSSTGDGAFSNDTNLTSSYTFGSADISNGFANIVLTSTGNGACNPAMDTITITLTAKPVSNAGADINTCSNSNNLSGSIINAGGGEWSSAGDGSFSPNQFDLNAVYIFGSSDISNGFVNIILTSTGNGVCAPAMDTITITLTAQPVSNAGADINTCSNTNNLSGAIINAGGGIWTSAGDGTFSNVTSLTSTYTFGSTDTTIGFVNIILTTTGNGGCTPATDSLIINLTNKISVNAGLDIEICENETSIELNGISSTGAGNWSSNGNGIINSIDSLSVIYSINENDSISNSIYFYFSSSNNFSCVPDNDTLRASFISLPKVDAGIDTSVTLGESIQLNGFTDATSYYWDNAGTLDDENNLIALSTPEIPTVYTLTAFNNNCSNMDSVFVNVIEPSFDNLVITNLITPNGDGKNDFWTMNHPEYLESCSITILNRWGTVVYSSIGYDNSWDGKLGSEILPDGSYYYIINCDDNNELRGSITLIRLND